MPHQPVFTLSLATALYRPVGQARAYYTRDEARAAVAYAFNRDHFALGDAPHFAFITHPDGTRESLEFGRVSLTDPEARRAKMLRFVKLMNAGNSRREFYLRLGDTLIRYESLTDAALEDLCSDMVSSFWFSKKINRQNRAIYARAEAGFQRTAEAA